jgi:Domain of unknown function (DUF4282)
MPDRSSHQGLPDEWNHGSHASRGPFSTAGASDGYGAVGAGSHRARPADGYGPGPADGYGTGPADGYGTGPLDVYGAGQADPLGARPDSFGPDAFGADAFGISPARTSGTGTADPFGDAERLGSRTGDPFGPATTAAFSAVSADTARPEADPPVVTIGDPAAGRAAADTKGFLGALFDFGFTSFVTPKVIKVLYMLIVIGIVVSALVFTIVVFKASVVFGFLMLVFGDPLFILIALAIYRVILEFFVVTFRVAEDIQALRERGNLG